MKPVPALLKMRSLVSNDGRMIQFFLLFKGGQNAGFGVPFHKIGLFISALKNVARLACERLSKNDEARDAETTAGLSDPAVVSGVAVGSDAETGEVLLSLETTHSGPFSFQLSPDAVSALRDALFGDDKRQDETQTSMARYG